jgi:hypothetical protein
MIIPRRFFVKTTQPFVARALECITFVAALRHNGRLRKCSFRGVRLLPQMASIVRAAALQQVPLSNLASAPAVPGLGPNLRTDIDRDCTTAAT